MLWCIPADVPKVWSNCGPVFEEPVFPLFCVQSNVSFLSWVQPTQREAPSKLQAKEPAVPRKKND